MVEEIVKIESLILTAYGFGITNATKDQECDEYFGCNFLVGSKHMKFRKAKLTPKKLGQFVTLWKRDAKGKTVPYDMDDDFEFYIILTEYAHHSGFFVFPKEILASMGILTSCVRAGKRGFRVYPEWDVPTSSQGIKTKNWQTEYFIEMNKEKKTEDKLQKIFLALYSQE